MKRSYNFFDFLENDPVSKIIIPVAEAGLDLATHEEFLRNIPGLRMIVDSYGLADSIRNRHLAKKLVYFFQQLDKTSIEEREQFIKKHSSNQNKLSQQIIIYLDRQEVDEKAKILGNLFAAFISEKFNYLIFSRLCSMLDKITVEDLMYLKEHLLRNIASGKNISEKIWLIGNDFEHMVSSGIINNLAGFGLNPGDVNLEDFGLEGDLHKHNQFYLNELGKKLIEYGLPESMN